MLVYKSNNIIFFGHVSEFRGNFKVSSVFYLFSSNLFVICEILINRKKFIAIQILLKKNKKERKKTKSFVTVVVL